MFHEFGHALHLACFPIARTIRLAAPPRTDFVEMPLTVQMSRLPAYRSVQPLCPSL